MSEHLNEHMNECNNECNNECKEIKQLFPDYLTGDLNKINVRSIQDHIAQCSVCRSELEELSHTWTQLGVLPEQEPGPNLRKNFYTMLESYQEGLDKQSGRFSIQKLVEMIFPRRPVFQLALAFSLLVTGFIVGYFLTLSNQGKYTDEVFQLRNREQHMRQELSLALLEQPSPSQRLKGITWSSTLQDPQPQMLEALLNTLNTDPNVNVRLSAVDALYLFSNEPLVKKGVSDSLAKQTSPLVQVALIDLLVELREKRAAESLKKLIKQEKINPAVKERAEIGLKTLI